jgi:hypothetical protein
MTGAWPHQLHTRLREFEAQNDIPHDGVSFSIKVRVTSGCFHREHSQEAYQAIDRALAAAASGRSVAFVEHENGPELLVYAAVAAAGLNFAKSVVDLVTAILKARSAGIKKGDRPSDPLELIVRRSHDGVKANEEIILRIAATERVDRNLLQTKLLEAVRRIHADE